LPLRPFACVFNVAKLFVPVALIGSQAGSMIGTAANGAD
jgi:hypothetical protein